jgi:hypothetical protein
MGLLYAFPVSPDEEDFVMISSDKVVVKTYGLPYLFWGYALAVIMVIVFMFLAIKDPVLKLMTLGDETDALLGYALLSFIGSLPLFIFAFFFFEKRLIKTKNQILLEYRVYGLKLLTQKCSPSPQEPYSVEPYLTSPNIARMKASEESQGFQNKGYFVLWLRTADGKKVALDRHSRKADLIKLQSLLEISTDS